MAALGFSINLSTLFGIALAIGIVVDDAIVIVEAVSHYIERGMTAHDAAVKAMGELTRLSSWPWFCLPPFFRG
jgi:hydrophobic/amphiphilic exporter-1 (mainly G- bacteria), HAE1 family